MSRTSARLLECATLSLLALLCSCSGGGNGDTPYKPENTKLSYYNDPKNPRPAENDYIDVTSVIIMGIDTYDETNTGAIGNLFVQDVGADPSPYSGITVYNPSFVPPDLTVFVGDVVDIRSPYMEFPGPSGGFAEGATLPELSGATVRFRFESPSLPAPKVVSVDDLLDYATGRQWIGVYAELRNVKLQNELSGSKGRLSAQLSPTDPGGKDPSKFPTISNGMAAIDTYPGGLQPGSYYTIRGIIQYFYNFTITPRSVDEIQPGS